MGRWRPPQPKSAPYITEDGYRALEAEQDALWLRRRSVVSALADAAAEGDRSENAEYIYRKKELAGIDRRIRYLQKRLPDLTIVSSRASADQVFFGAWVSLEDEHGDPLNLRIVGADEIDANQGLISVDSPMAKALLGRHCDDEFTLRTGDDTQAYVITAIRYDEAP